MESADPGAPPRAGPAALRPGRRSPTYPTHGAVRYTPA